MLDEVAALSPATQVEAAARARRAQIRAAGRHRNADDRGAADRHHQRRSGPRGRRGTLPRRAVFSLERADASSMPALARAARRHRAAGRALARADGRGARPAGRVASTKPRARRWRLTTGPATFANSRTPSSARWSSRTSRCSGPRTCRKIFARPIRAPPAGLRSLEEIEHEAIQATLEATRYKITRAAEILGISRKTLLDKRKKYGLQLIARRRHHAHSTAAAGQDAPRRKSARCWTTTRAASAAIAELEIIERCAKIRRRRCGASNAAAGSHGGSARRRQASTSIPRNSPRGWAAAATERVREIVFLCGAAEGFPEALARRATMRISLSPMTFSHELARVMLAEQLYRAFALLAGHPYPK